jgi:5-methylcytosine-specific restriction endonuclease McrA
MRELSRTFPRENNSLGEPICPIPNCNQICEKFKNGNWKTYCNLHDGYSMIRESHWSAFKVRILIRDGNACVKCGSKDQLEVDHIRAIMNDGENWEENNLQTLCKECHKKKTKNDWKIKKNKLNEVLSKW